jgi:siroheme synthase-like protein
VTGQAYPIVLTNLQSARCVIAGGGRVAERKVVGLLEAGAHVVVVSPELTPRLQQLAHEGRLEYIPRAWEDNDLQGAFMVIAATNNRAVNAGVARAARNLGLLVNVADAPDEGNFNTAAAVRRGDLLLGISTGGASPAVSALVRRKAEATFGPEYAELLDLLRALRPRVTRAAPEQARQRIWRELASDQALDWIRAGNVERARRYAEDLIAQAGIDSPAVSRAIGTHET